MVKTSKREQEILQQVLKTIREPLPKNGSPHVVVIVYGPNGWAVSKAAPKGKGG